MKIWSFWEGPKPHWIQKCQDSLTFHGGNNVSILDWNGFKKIWTEDTDLPINELYVVQKSDFIRSYLLHHFGGMWIDADCLIMKDLSPILESCRHWDFLYYRQKSGDISNAFIGAKKGSEVADHFYRGVRWRIKQPQPIGWLDLGCRKLTEALNLINGNTLQLSHEMVAPYDWNEGGVYFNKGEDHELEHLSKPNALCHMLSNHSIKGHDPQIAKDLNDKKTLFSFLMRKSTGE